MCGDDVDAPGDVTEDGPDGWTREDLDAYILAATDLAEDLPHFPDGVDWATLNRWLADAGIPGFGPSSRSRGRRPAHGPFVFEDEAA